MNIKDVFEQLNEAYSDKNLNEISAKLILHYKAKDFVSIRQFANKISKYVNIDAEKDAKCFSSLMMLYHPDKGESYRIQIRQLYEQNDLEHLKGFEHVLLMSDIENVVIQVVDEDVEYHPEYVWEEENADGFQYTNDDEYEGEFADADYERSFYNLIKMREYGKIDIELPTYYFEDFEEYEMNDAGMDSLDGVEYCIHAKILDVSNNSVEDISDLWHLQHLEELYLSDNQIGIIDALASLTALKIVDLSGNQIDDISPLFGLENLEYVNLIGNPILPDQVKILERKGCVVCC